MQGVQVYVSEEEVEESLLKLVFGIDTWLSTHISLAQACHITNPDVKDVTGFNLTMVWDSQYLGRIIQLAIIWELEQGISFL